MNDEPDNDAPQDDTARYAIGELAEAGGVSRRAVRFYVQRGLIDPPLGGGRGAYYSATHLAQLIAIKRSQEAGMPLQAIAQAFEEAPPEPVPVESLAPERWTRLVLAPGVELHLRQDALTPAQEAALVQAARLATPTRPTPTPTTTLSEGELE